MKILLSASIVIYLSIVLGTSGANLYLMFNPRESSLKTEVRDYVEKEVDRSYNRFFTQYNFAIFLIGISVWLLRQSVIDQLKADVKKDVEQRLDVAVKSEVEKYINNDVNIQHLLQDITGLDSKLKAELEKSRIVEELSMFIPPEEVFFQEQTDRKIQERLRKLVSDITDHIESNKELLSLTVDDYIKLGDALYCLEEYEAAAEQYGKAVDEHADAYRALFGIGNALRKQGQKLEKEGQDQQANQRFHEAIKKYEKTIEINPYYFVAYVNKGLAHRRFQPGSEGLEEGIKCFDQAIDISPNYYRAWYDKACYYTLLGEKPDKAMSYLKRAICIAPKQCKDLAKKDKDFCSIQGNERFIKLIRDDNAECEQNSEE
ncbi:TPR end-of-group domain-containing protein [Scytonema sp. PCC 10023]|uniref:TPR end-of-group domain-containing protein n=1 Tax=Scytonema sp. PCC 10023 TaxID=1680591 RepID=UPI0039C6A3FA